MKAISVANILTASAIALGSIVTINQSSYAQTTTYFCGTSKDAVPTTFARIATGQKVAVIRWEKKWSNKYSPKARCEEVSARFQNASQDGALNYLTIGTINNQKVLCAASRYGDGCKDVLLTLRANEDASKFIENLRQMGYTAQGPMVQAQDASPPVYVDMNQLLHQSPTE